MKKSAKKKQRKNGESLREPSDPAFNYDSVNSLFDLATGYQKAKVFFALLEFKIPTLLQKGKMTAKEIAAKLKIEEIAANRLLNAAVALEILAKKKDKFANNPASAKYLIVDSPEYLGGQFLRYDESSYPLWNDLTASLKKWKQGATAADVPEEDDQGGDALADQHNYALLTGSKLGEYFDFKGYRKMLDLGGGTGAMSIAVCRDYKNLSSIVYDLPEISATAAKFIKKAGLENRIETGAGNFQTDELPAGFDVALLANFMSVADEKTNRELLKRIYEKLPKGGAVILSGWILDDAANSPLVPVLFCLEDICRNAPDVERTAKTYTKWLRRAGFKNIERRHYHSPTSLIAGYKL